MKSSWCGKEVPLCLSSRRGQESGGRKVRIEGSLAWFLGSIVKAIFNTLETLLLWSTRRSC
jgi:hypothetical protein